MQHHRDPKADLFLSAEVQLAAMIRTGYGGVTEPSVTSEIALKPARFSSPITAITLP